MWIRDRFEEQGVQVHAYVGEFQTVLGLIGDTSGSDVEMLELLDIVERVTPVSYTHLDVYKRQAPTDLSEKLESSNMVTLDETRIAP